VGDAEEEGEPPGPGLGEEGEAGIEEGCTDGVCFSLPFTSR